MSLGGAEHRLRHGDYSAVVTEVGGGLRRLSHRDRDLVLAYSPDEVRPRYRGAVLAPWVNRIVDGCYTFDGVTHQLDLNEPERHHALHGLVCWVRWQVAELSVSSARLVHRLVPRPGYPFEVELEVTYRLDDHGLTWTVLGRNVGSMRAPYGAAGHPYLLGGTGTLDDWTLTLPAARVLEVTPDRLVPSRLRDVDGTQHDFRTGRLLDGVEVDHAYTALLPGRGDLVRATLTDSSGVGVACTWDAGILPWVQVHTADLPDAAQSRLGLALEPMTSPPDAFSSGTDLVVLEPGESHEATWSLAAM